MAKTEAPAITTERLTLRRREERDIPAMTAMFNTEAVRKYLFGPAPREEHDMLKILRARTQTMWHAELKATGEFIGECGFWGVSEGYYAEISYIFREEYWGKGYALEAMKAAIAHGTQHWNITTVSAKINAQNERSRRLAERLGLKLDCVIPQFEIDGTIADVARYRKALI